MITDPMVDPKNLTPEQAAMLDRSLLVRFTALELIDLLSSLRVLNISHKDKAVNSLEAKIEQCLGDLCYEPHAGAKGLERT